MPRFPPVDAEQAPEPARQILQTTPLSLLGIVAHAESVFERWLSYSNALLTRLALDPLLRELAILQVAHMSRSQYEWVQHVAIAKAVGASDAQVEAIERQRLDDPSFSAEQSRVLAFTHEVVEQGEASERAVDELTPQLGARGVVELLLVVGHYMAIARVIATAGLEPQPPVFAGDGPLRR
ncbi:MAG TPA: carboxymuconolactone decarboxylase family protein [Solirubrobacteraceae bacterium]|jgi:alkylhydroperoxidase family enzyme|nr:carboxymuconolactone decarboxylase family protein [Solirubrobacteraceae bacterium]